MYFLNIIIEMPSHNILSTYVITLNSTREKTQSTQIRGIRGKKEDTLT